MTTTQSSSSGSGSSSNDSNDSARHPANALREQSLTFGQRAAERMAKLIGSWSFLIVQSCILLLWLVANAATAFAWLHHWDPYPFILLNLMLSFQAAYTGPILLIAANRQEAHARTIADATYVDTEMLKQLITDNALQLQENTRLTLAVHELTLVVHAHIMNTTQA